MATITTTIREPKTFQQIQDQQNELGKNQTLESLNNNISKLIKAITDRDEKRETEQDRQLKMNQLELSKLQLRRAQLGLAKDEKYYSDYSRKWSEKNNFGTSIGLDRNTSGNIGAVGVSALTAGALNPVIVKNLLFPIMTPLMNVTKALATFPGLLPGLFRRSSGKSSSAIASDPDRKLHGKLDQILGAIKDKTKSSKAKEEKEQSMLSKFLNALLLGAAGMFTASKLLGGASNSVINTLEKYGPAMIAGYALGGWKGALVGLGIQLFGEAIGLIEGDDSKPDLIKDGFAEIKKLLPSGLKDKFTESQFKGMVGGFILGGTKGALLGFALGTETIQNAISKISEGKFDELYIDLSDNIDALKKDTIFESVPSDSILGAISGGIIGSRFGWKGLMIGSILGAVGGFAWDRYKNANLPEQYGFHSEFNPSTLNWELANLGKTWSDFDQEARDSLEQEIKDKKRKSYTQEERLAYTKTLIEQAYKEKGVSKEGKSFWEATGDYAKQAFVENPVETSIIAGGTMAAAYGLLNSATTRTANLANELITKTGLSPKIKSFIKGGLMFAAAEMIQQATNRVNEEYEKRMTTEEGIFKSASDNLFEMGIKAVKDGRFMDAADSFWQGTFAYATEISMDLMDRQKNRQQYEEGVQSVTELLKGASGQRELTFGERHGLIDSFKSNESIKNGLAWSALLDQVKLLEGINNSFVTSNAELQTLIRNSPVIREATKLSEEEINEINDYLSFTKEVTKEDIPHITYLVSKLQQGGYTWLDNKNTARITNKENEDKINKEEKKQREEENQCLKENTDEMSTLTKTLENLDRTAKGLQPNQTPIPYDEPVPQYTPVPAGHSQYN